MGGDEDAEGGFWRQWCCGRAPEVAGAAERACCASNGSAMSEYISGAAPLWRSIAVITNATLDSKSLSCLQLQALFVRLAFLSQPNQDLLTGYCLRIVRQLPTTEYPQHPGSNLSPIAAMTIRQKVTMENTVSPWPSDRPGPFQKPRCHPYDHRILLHLCIFYMLLKGYIYGL